MLIPTTNDELDYARLFDPGEGKIYQGYGQQRTGSFYAPERAKWLRKDCPLCHEPFAVVRRRAKYNPKLDIATDERWYCTNCHRDITSEMKIIA